MIFTGGASGGPSKRYSISVDAAGSLGHGGGHFSAGFSSKVTSGLFFLMCSSSEPVHLL